MFVFMYVIVTDVGIVLDISCMQARIDLVS